MKTLRQLVREYLETRRSLGFELYRPGKALESFVRFCEEQGTAIITTEMSVRWATQPVNAAPETWAERLALVRRFARYCSAFQSRTEIPPQDTLPARYRRKAPYVYDRGEIVRLMRAARQLPSKLGLRAATIETLLGLLAATGMRIGEALALDVVDVDLAQGVLTLRRVKYDRVRYVPIHRSTLAALSHYARQRDQCVPQRETAAYFVSERATRMSQGAVRTAFHQLLALAGIKTPDGCRRPRIHDLRHSFAVRTLLRWYADGVAVDAHLPRLATYIGHAHVADTYWYITAVPELMQCAAQRADAVEREREA